MHPVPPHTPEISEPETSVRAVFRRFWPYTPGNRKLLVAGGLFFIAAAGEVAAIWQNYAARWRRRGPRDTPSGLRSRWLAGPGGSRTAHRDRRARCTP
jgi:hypothetical protein